MTVGELITILQTVRPETRVLVPTSFNPSDLDEPRVERHDLLANGSFVELHDYSNFIVISDGDRERG